jgi:hypothetical protein
VSVTGSPLKGDFIEWLDEGGERLVIDRLEGGGRAGPGTAFEYILLLLGGAIGWTGEVTA